MPIYIENPIHIFSIVLIDVSSEFKDFFKRIHNDPFNYEKHNKAY